MSRIKHAARAVAERRSRLAVVVALALLLVTAIAPQAALAHERREVEGYSLLVGFIAEPAYEGEQNGVDFRVNRGDGDGEPVEGLAETVQVEVTHVDSATSRTFPLRGLFGQPGRYTADLVPTAPGAYEFRFFGTIDGVQIDETFASSSLGGGFDDVHPIAEIQFPDTIASPREQQGAATGARASALAAEDAAQAARNLAIAGIALGILGTAAGVTGVAIGLRRR